jgi:hypothetical protein
VTEKDGFVWHFTGFYGEPRSDQREISWRALRTLNASRRHLWLCMGDFNGILMSHEKQGGCLNRKAVWTDLGRSLRSVDWWIWNSQVIYLHGEIIATRVIAIFEKGLTEQWLI